MRPGINSGGLAIAALLVFGACKGGAVSTKAAPTTDPDKLVRLVSIRAVPSSIGAFVVGEVKNQSKKPVQGVKIEAKLRILGVAKPLEELGFTLVDVLAPGVTAPFSIPITVEGVQIEEIDASLSAAEAPPDAKVALAIPSKKHRKNGPLYEVSGSIKNDKSTKVTSPKVAATFYDARGRVVGAEVAHLDPLVLGPGESASFKVTLNERQKQVTRYKLISEATVGEVEGVKPLPSPPPPEPMNEGDQTPPVEEPAPPGGEPAPPTAPPAPPEGPVAAGRGARAA